MSRVSKYISLARHDNSIRSYRRQRMRQNSSKFKGKILPREELKNLPTIRIHGTCLTFIPREEFREQIVACRRITTSSRRKSEIAERHGGERQKRRSSVRNESSIKAKKQAVARRTEGKRGNVDSWGNLCLVRVRFYFDSVTRTRDNETVAT